MKNCPWLTTTCNIDVLQTVFFDLQICVIFPPGCWQNNNVSQKKVNGKNKYCLFMGKKTSTIQANKMCRKLYIIFITVCISRLVYIKTTEITYSWWLGVSRMFFQDHPMQSSADINNVGFPMVSSNLSGKPIWFLCPMLATQADTKKHN